MGGSGSPVVVAGLFLNGTSVVRRVAELGYDAWAISYDRSEQGWRSRRGQKVLCPHPTEAFDEWVEFMRELAGRFDQAPALIPCSDIFVLALERAAPALAGVYRFHGFGSGLRAALTSKRTTFELAERHGFPRPKTQFVNNRIELAAFARGVGGPTLIKPDLPASWRAGEAREVAGGRKVIVGRDVDDILAGYEQIAPYTPSVLAQEVIPGPDSNLLYWCGFVRGDGVVCGRLIGRKLRVAPIHFGSASFVQLVDRPDLEDLCERFLTTLGYSGLCGIELKEDPRDGVAKLIEVNPRWGLWDDIGVPVGVDLVGEAVSALFGGSPQPQRPRHFRQKWAAVSWDLPVFFRYRSEGLITTATWLADYRPPIRINDLPLLSDFPYALGQIRTLTTKICKELGRRLGGRGRDHHAVAAREKG